MTTGHANAHRQRGGMPKKILDLLFAPNAGVQSAANKALDLLGTHSGLVLLMMLGLVGNRCLVMLGRRLSRLVLRRCGRGTKDQLDAQLGSFIFGLRGHDGVVIDRQHAAMFCRRLHVGRTDQSFHLFLLSYRLTSSSIIPTMAASTGAFLPKVSRMKW